MANTQMTFAVLAMLVVLALAFDFMNGFHDAANSIATIVSTGVLKPHHAVAWAAIFNLFAIFVFQLKVAATVGAIGLTSSSDLFAQAAGTQATATTQRFGGSDATPTPRPPSSRSSG